MSESVTRATSRPFLYADRATLDAAIASSNVPRDGKGRPLLRADLPRLDFWIGKPIGHGRLSRIVRKTKADDEARRPVGSWIAGLNEPTPDDQTHVLRSDRQGVATTEIEPLFGEQAFNYPKPSSLIRSLVKVTTGDGDIVLDFFAGSGTTGAAVYTLNAEDDANRTFILVSSTEATNDEPRKNLCRDVCAVRLRKVLAGAAGDDPMDGDFAYLRTRRISWDDVIYDLDQAALWTLLQLRHARQLRVFEPSASIQVAFPTPERSEEPVLALVPVPHDAAVAQLRLLATSENVVAFIPVPGLLRDKLEMPTVPIEHTPDRILAEFPQIVAGL